MHRLRRTANTKQRAAKPEISTFSTIDKRGVRTVGIVSGINQVFEV
jgi:hypothetical protein